MKKYAHKLLFLGGLILVSLALFTGAVKAAPSFFDINQSASATTTVQYLTAGSGSYTYYLGNLGEASNDNVDYNQLFLQMTASTSATTLHWTYQFSNGASCSSSTANCDWYEEDNTITDPAIGALGSIDHASTTVTHRWNPGSSTASTTRKTLAVPDVPSRWKRVVFTVPSGSTNASVFVQDTAKQLPQD